VLWPRPSFDGGEEEEDEKVLLDIPSRDRGDLGVFVFVFVGEGDGVEEFEDAADFERAFEKSGIGW